MKRTGDGVGVKAYRVPVAGPGALWMMPKPRSDHLAEDLAQLRAMGVDQVVSLLEPMEAERLGLSGEPAACEAVGLGYLSFPIADFGVPEEVAFRDLVEDLRGQLAEGGWVLVHCCGGIGRSGLLVCCLVADKGASAEEVMAQVSAVRGEEVPETDAQRAMIKRVLGGMNDSKKERHS
ncbi:MAG: tyrosine protein phosphatase [Pseudomonadota bacterium]